MPSSRNGGGNARDLWQAAFQFASGFGHQAVVAFFVLSGLLVTQSSLHRIRGGTWTLRRFLINRWTRLAVVVLPALAAGFALDRLGLSMQGEAERAAELFKSEVVSNDGFWVYLGNAAFLQTIFVPCVGSNWALWSLSNEFWYYVLFGLGAFVLTAPSTRTRKALALGAALVIVATLATTGAGFRRSSMLGMAGIWMLGAGVAIVQERSPQRTRSTRASHWPALLAVGITCVVRARLIEPGLTADYVQSVAMLPWLVLSGRTPGKAAAQSVWLAPSLWLGKISYSLYATHFPLMFVLVPLFGGHALLALNARSIGVHCIIVAIMLGYAWVFHRLFESRTERVQVVAERLAARVDAAAASALRSWRPTRRRSGGYRDRAAGAGAGAID
jgi:peptidoglycan/LPS O-acetylase OafA/YrhL